MYKYIIVYEGEVLYEFMADSEAEARAILTMWPGTLYVETDSNG